MFEKIPTMSAKEVHDAMERGDIILIDVREPGEYAAERIHGALLFPLSTFDPSALPHDRAQPIVFHCAGGKRSENAMRACLKANIPVRAHMAGGIAAWKSSGLPTVSIDPDTGAVRDRQ